MNEQILTQTLQFSTALRDSLETLRSLFLFILLQQNSEKPAVLKMPSTALHTHRHTHNFSGERACLLAYKETDLSLCVD